MGKVLKISIILAFFSITFISCSDVSRKVDEKIEQLLKKTESLDSLLNQEIDKVLTLDSLIQKSTSKLDSVVNKITKPLSK